MRHFAIVHGLPPQRIVTRHNPVLQKIGESGTGTLKKTLRVVGYVLGGAGILITIWFVWTSAYAIVPSTWW